MVVCFDPFVEFPCVQRSCLSLAPQCIVFRCSLLSFDVHRTSSAVLPGVIQNNAPHFGHASLWTTGFLKYTIVDFTLPLGFFLQRFMKVI